MDRAVHHHHENTKSGSRNGVHSPSRVPETFSKTFSRLVVARHLTKTLFSYTSGMALEMATLVSLSVHHFGLDCTISTIGRIAMKVYTNINGPQRMKPADFGEPLMFPLVPA